jgi:mono/diheme cytochrome c family protein
MICWGAFLKVSVSANSFCPKWARIELSQCSVVIHDLITCLNRLLFAQGLRRLFVMRNVVNQITSRNSVSVLCVSLLWLVWPALSNAQAFDPYSGEETYMRYCAACHGETAQGNGPVARGLPIAVPDLTRLQERKGNKFPDDVLRKIIDGREVVVVHGTRYMPVWGYEFWVEEGADDEAQTRVDLIVANLIEYLRSIQR